MPNQKVFDRAMELMDVKLSVLQAEYRQNKRFRTSSVKALINMCAVAIVEHEREQRPV